MKIVEYFSSECPKHWLSEIGRCDWRAGQYLHQLLRDGQFHSLLGEKSKLLLLTEGNHLIAFCTYAQRDEIPTEELTPWAGFVYTFPQERGKRRMGKLLEYVYLQAKADGYPCVYISTDHTGLYEKYGCTFWKTMQDAEGNDCRIYRMNIKRWVRKEPTTMCDNIEATQSYQSLLSSTTNTRDLGGFPISAGRWTQRNTIWRSDAPVVFCETDEQLLKELNITTIIDLRTDSEAKRKPCAYARRSGFEYQHFPITAGSVPPNTLEEVPFTYLQIAQQREAAEAIHAIASAETGVLFCCTAGKDRTGVIAALLLSAYGVDRQLIIEDYVVSRYYNQKRLERYLEEHPETDRRIVLANETSMERFLELFAEHCGGIEQYFEQSGLSTADLALIRRKLLPYI